MALFLGHGDMPILHKEIQKIVRFVIKYSSYFDKDKIKEFITLHLRYKTCIVVYDDKDNIVAVARWNISPSGTSAQILDVMVREDVRGNGILRQLICRGLRMFPTVKYLSWERETKYPDRETKYYSVEQLLKIRR